MIQLIKYPSKKKLEEVLVRPSQNNDEVQIKVRDILRNVKCNGDKALKDYASQYDKVALKRISVSEKEIASASRQVDEKLKRAIQVAYRNIYTFHVAQREKIRRIETMPGIVCWRKSVAIENIGLYIPGGSAPLFSTVLMLGIPAKIAGSKNVILCTPPGKDQNIHPSILFTAQLCGIKKIYKVGGAQAIAAMAYGTKTIHRVDKIFGPGSQYVTVAKQLVNNERVAIDLPAGPSEVCVIADDTCMPEFVAADLLSQAEHGADSHVILISNSETVIRNCLKEIDRLIGRLPRKSVAMKALDKSKCILVKNINDAVDLANFYAPEHLILACKNPNTVAEKINNAGSVFLGNYSPESVGDYASGTNHTLPTAGYARSYSGVSLDSFFKKITFQQISKKGIEVIGSHIEAMAAAEGLDAHKLAVRVRLNSL